MKSFSIVIPHYNNSNGLERLLGSIYDIKNHTVLFDEFINKLQVIVVDDYSDNDNFNSLRLLNNKYRFKLIKNNRKKSAGTCRNIGLSLVKTDYVIFADSDDFLSEDYWKILIDEVNSNDFDIAFFSPKCVLNDNFNIVSNRHIDFELYIQKYFKNKDEKKLRYAWFVPWSRVFRTSFLKDNSIYFDETIVSNDVMFSVRSGHIAKNIYVSNKNIYISTKRPNSLVNKFNVNNIKTRIKIGLDYKIFCDSCGYKEHPDNCFGWFFCYFFKKPELFLYFFKYAIKIGALKDYRYFFKYVIVFFKRKIENKLIKILNLFVKKFNKQKKY